MSKGANADASTWRRSPDAIRSRGYHTDTPALGTNAMVGSAGCPLNGVKGHLRSAPRSHCSGRPESPGSTVPPAPSTSDRRTNPTLKALYATKAHTTTAWGTSGLIDPALPPEGLRGIKQRGWALLQMARPRHARKWPQNTCPELRATDAWKAAIDNADRQATRPGHTAIPNPHSSCAWQATVATCESQWRARATDSSKGASDSQPQASSVPATKDPEARKCHRRTLGPAAPNIESQPEENLCAQGVT
mmetsp:Transcript_25009/g.74620  ORF Transcript_25009/g.74620 Transcript_25009/m.74620 type:complete len:248 (-) Transcript_25009:769-1512(-)